MKKNVKQKIEWIHNEHNEFLEGKGFHISYNPDTRITVLGDILDDFLSKITGGMVGGEETAFFSSRENKYFVLSGDFRREYEKAFSLGYAACKRVYLKHKKLHQSPASEDFKIKVA